MSVKTWFTGLFTRFQKNDIVKEVEKDAEAIGEATYDYIKKNALSDLYNIAIAALMGVTSGTPYTAVLATVLSQGKAAGITIAKGAEAIVVAQAQADLIAAGKLVAPSTGAVVN